MVMIVGDSLTVRRIEPASCAKVSTSSPRRTGSTRWSFADRDTPM
jgi:hypothetical protein